MTVLILMLVSVFAVACGPNPNIAADMGILETEAPDLIALEWWANGVSVPNNIIRPNSDYENAVFIVTAETGYFYENNNDIVRTISLQAEERTFYRHTLPVRENFLDFVKIVVKEEEHIIGYALIKVTLEMNNYDYVPELIRSAIFPQVDGEYQDITQEQMNAIFENFKKE